MASISCNQIAFDSLQRCLAGDAPPLELVHQLVDANCSDALFRIVVEGLADRFEPRLCDAYADLFSAVIERVLGLRGLRERYERVRQPRVCRLEPKRITVLSRVTLGADIAITSVILDAMKKRFPNAEIFLAGGRKAAELFAEDRGIQHLPLPYPRSGSLHERLSTWTTLPGMIVDPDSRLTQLGLLPVCPEDQYFFFESRAYGGNSDADLTTLTRRWVRETFEVADCAPYIAPRKVHSKARVAVSFGVGENMAKRVGGAFEADLLRLLASRADRVIVDLGAGGEETRRVKKAIGASRARNIGTWNGSFAGFASLIAQSEFYVGYDSAGQHAAAACGIPQLTIFRGYISERMFHRWRPTGKGTRILKHLDPEKLLRILPEFR